MVLLGLGVGIKLVQLIFEVATCALSVFTSFLSTSISLSTKIKIT